MHFYFDESGNFQLPPAREHRVGIVSGIVIPETHEAEVFRRFDGFVGTLPASAFKNGEPKGRLLDDAGCKALAEMLINLPGILVCPTMLDLTSLVGGPQIDGARLSRKLMAVQAACEHKSFRDELIEFANDASRLSQQQTLRLMAWAKGISRTIQDSIIFHSSGEYEPSWNSLRFEIDPVEEAPGSREERVLEKMLPGWVSGWSRREPFMLIEEIHTANHPFVKNWDRDTGLDIGKMFRNNVHYVTSAESKGIQLTDMIATLVRRAAMGVRGLYRFDALRNYGFMMTKSIGRAEMACGLTNLTQSKSEGLERRYLGLVDAIKWARQFLSGSYCEP
jgi:hypothetical protein